MNQDTTSQLEPEIEHGEEGKNRPSWQLVSGLGGLVALVVVSVLFFGVNGAASNLTVMLLLGAIVVLLIGLLAGVRLMAYTGLGMLGLVILLSLIAIISGSGPVQSQSRYGSSSSAVMTAPPTSAAPMAGQQSAEAIEPVAPSVAPAAPTTPPAVRTSSKTAPATTPPPTTTKSPTTTPAPPPFQPDPNAGSGSGSGSGSGAGAGSGSGSGGSSGSGSSNGSGNSSGSGSSGSGSNSGSGNGTNTGTIQQPG